MMPSTPLRVIVVDDEAPARQRLADLLAATPGVELASAYASGRRAADALRAAHQAGTSPDLVFLDVQMPEVSGLDVVRRVGPEAMPVVVFVTAYDQYALDAFDMRAVDYLLKPFDDDRFQEALARAREIVRLRQSDRLRTNLLAVLLDDLNDETPRIGVLSDTDRLPVPSARGIVLIPIQDIEHIEADGPYAKIHANGQCHLLRESMQSLDRRLDPSAFIRVHRSSIVRLDRIKVIEPYGREVVAVRLSSGARVRVSRRRVDALRKRLGLRSQGHR